MRARTRRLGTVVVMVVALATVGAWALVSRGCGRQVLVEQFDNGPVGGPVRGPAGPSEGFKWVDEDERPTPGKHWKRVDPMTLTPEQRRELGLDEVRGDTKRDAGTQ